MGFLKLLPAKLKGGREKMKKHILISIAVVAMLLVGIFGSSVLASNTRFAPTAVRAKDVAMVTATSDVPETEVNKREVVSATLNVKAVDEIEKLPENELEDLKADVPETYEETDSLASVNRVRFLLYTHDGKHIMWGYVGNGYFVGTDNNGKQCWGIYGNGVFAGLYSNGDFFWGRYRSGHWKSEGLFGLNCSFGQCILFPTSSLTADTP